MANRPIMKKISVSLIAAAIVILVVGGLVYKKLIFRQRSFPVAIWVEPFGNTSGFDMDYVDLQGCAEIIRMAAPAFAKTTLARTIVGLQLFWMPDQPVASRKDAQLLAERHNCRFVVRGIFQRDKGRQIELVVGLFDANRSRWYEEKFHFAEGNDTELEEKQLQAARLVINKINELLKNKLRVPEYSSTASSESPTGEFQKLQTAWISLEPIKTIHAINSCTDLLSQDTSDHNAWSALSRLYWSLGYTTCTRYRSLYKNYYLKSYAALCLSEMLGGEVWENRINRALLSAETLRIRAAAKLAYDLYNEKPEDLITKATLCLCVKKEKPLKEVLSNSLQAPIYYYILAKTVKHNGKDRYAASFLQAMLHAYPNSIDALQFVCRYSLLGAKREFLVPYTNRTNYQVLRLLCNVGLKQYEAQEQIKSLLIKAVSASSLYSVDVSNVQNHEEVEEFLKKVLRDPRNDWELGLRPFVPKKWPKELNNIVGKLMESQSSLPDAVRLGQSIDHWFEFLYNRICELQEISSNRTDTPNVIRPGFFDDRMKLEFANYLLQTCRAAQARFGILSFSSYPDSKAIMVPWQRISPHEPEFNVFACIYEKFGHPLSDTISRDQLFKVDPQADDLYRLSSKNVNIRSREHGEILETGLRISPRNARITYWLSQHYRAIRNQTKEIQLNLKAYQHDPYDPWVVDRYWASVGGQAGVKGYHEAGEEMSENIDMLNMLGWVFSYYWPILDEPKAIGYYRKSIEECPHNRDAYKRLSDIYLRNGKMQECLNVLKSFLDTDPDSLAAASTRTKIGQLYCWMKQPEKARPFLLEAAETWKADAMFEYAKCLLDLKEYGEAAFFLKRCIDRYEPYYEAWEELACVYEKWDKQEQAEQTMRIMLSRYNTAYDHFNNFFDKNLDYDRYIKVFETLDTPVVRAEELDRLTRGYAQRLQWDKAIEYGKACLAKIQESKLSPEEQISWRMRIKRMIASYYAAKWVPAYLEKDPKVQQEILSEVTKFDDPDLFVFLGNTIFYLPRDPNKPNGQIANKTLLSLAEEMTKHLKTDSSVAGLCRVIKGSLEFRNQLCVFFAAKDPYKNWKETKKYCKAVVEFSKSGFEKESQELSILLVKSLGYDLFIGDAIEMFEYCFGTEDGRTELLKLLPDSDLPHETKEWVHEYIHSIPDWHILGPIPNPTYELFDTVIPLDNTMFEPNAEYTIEGKTYRWKRYFPNRQMGMCNLDYIIDGKDEKNILYAGRWIEAPEAGNYFIGVTKTFMGVTLFLDGEKVTTIAYTDNKRRKQGFGIELTDGRHFIMFKFSQENNQYSFWTIIRKPNRQPLIVVNGN